MTTTKLSTSVKLGYGFPGLSYNLALYVFITFSMPFFVETVGLAPAFAGMLAALGTLWDAITDPTVGIISDNMNPRTGRRRPFSRRRKRV